MPSYKYGNQFAGFTPEDTKITGASNALYDPSFDFKKYDIHYNPWGEGADAEAMKQSFEEQLKANDAISGQEYNALSRKEAGYTYTQLGGVGAKAEKLRDSMVTFGEDGVDYQTLGMSKRQAFESGIKKGDTFVKQGEDREGKTIWGQINVGKAGKYGLNNKRASQDEAYGRGDITVMAAGQELNEVEAYKKWRYDVAAAQMKADIGTGVNEAYTGLDYLGTEVDKTMGQDPYSRQAGPAVEDEIGRAQRQAGTREFKRRDIFSRRQVAQNLGQRRQEERGNGDNKQTGIQLGG